MIQSTEIFQDTFLKGWVENAGGVHGRMLHPQPNAEQT